MLTWMRIVFTQTEELGSKRELPGLKLGITRTSRSRIMRFDRLFAI